jgi:hypothetical protein
LPQIEPVSHQYHRQSWHSSGRRLALANWLTSADNPLVARVVVNHVWLRHFGRGLVETPAEFGTRGRPPTHPELLDWLAVQFRNHHWSMKWLHYTIVTSNTYRMSSSSRGLSACLKTDAQNQFYWHGPSKRAEAEVIRDSILHLAGKLDETIGGPDEDHNKADTSTRRSLYLRSSRVDRALFLETFDAARVEECYQRTESIVPQQALALLNSEFVWRGAETIARRLEQRAGLGAQPTGADFAREAFELIVGRPPSDEEMLLCRGFLREQKKLLEESSVGGAEARARTYLVHSLLNHNDFISIR